MISTFRDGVFNAKIILLFTTLVILIEIRTPNSDNRKMIATDKTIPIDAQSRQPLQIDTIF